MIYFDTSFLAPLVLPESSSGDVMAFVQSLTNKQQTVSHWARVEFSSLIARKVRTGELDEDGAARADARFEEMVAGSFAIVLPSAEDFTLAKRYLATFATGLRAPDALHLAIASNHGAAAIYSLDKGFLKAGRILGLPVAMGIEI